MRKLVDVWVDMKDKEATIAKMVDAVAKQDSAKIANMINEECANGCNIVIKVSG